MAFSTDGSILASASADGTVKIWKVTTGERLDTLGQPEGEQCAVAISPDNAWIVAGGADRQVRKWRLLSRDAPQINPLVFSRTAHESSIVELAFSPDGSQLVSASEGGELMLWDAEQLTPIHRYEQQPDVVTGIAFDPDGEGFYIARIDGSWQRYAIATGDEGDVAKHDKTAGDETVAVTPAATEPTPFDGTEQEPNDSPATANEISATAVVRGIVGAPDENSDPDVDLFRFHARQGQQLVLEINAARQKSPLDSHVAVLDGDRQPDSARRAASGATLVLHVSRPRFDVAIRLSAAQMAGYGAQRISVCQRRGREAVVVPAGPGLGLFGVPRHRRQSIRVFWHDGDHARAERAVLYRRAAFARHEAHPQRPAGIHAVL